MTHEETIEYLKWIRPKKPWSLDNKNVQIAIDKAIKALEQQKTGHWVKIAPYPMQTHEYACSECGHETHDNTENYCSECGARMEDIDDDNK